MKLTDIAWFVAEVAAYAALVAYALTRPLRMWARVALAVAGVGAFAVAWGTFAAPQASQPLSGTAGVAFRAAWFGLAALAGVAAIARRTSPPSPTGWLRSRAESQPSRGGSGVGAVRG